MALRIDLQDLLESLLGSGNVYFQPPVDIQMSYPCIRYELDDIITSYGDNIPYNNAKRYKITVIDRNPDSVIPDKVGALKMSSFDRFYKADGLNHFVYNLFS